MMPDKCSVETEAGHRFLVWILLKIPKHRHICVPTVKPYEHLPPPIPRSPDGFYLIGVHDTVQLNPASAVRDPSAPRAHRAAPASVVIQASGLKLFLSHSVSLF